MAAFIEPFVVFDPLTGDPPSYGEARFHDVIVRARALLGDWDRATIDRAVDVIDWLFEEQRGAHSELEFARLEAMTADDNGGSRDHGNPTEVRDFFTLIGQQPPPTIDDLPDISWPRLFAVAALAYIGESCRQIATWDTWSPHPRQRQREVAHMYETLCWREAIEGLAGAIEALGFAERLGTQPPPHKDTALAYWRREGASNAALRHRTGNTLKRRFIDFYCAGTFKNQAFAFRQFEKSLTAAEKDDFKHLDRMCLKALRHHLKRSDGPTD